MKTIKVEITHRDPDILEQKVEDYYRGYPPLGTTLVLKARCLTTVTVTYGVYCHPT